MLSSGSVGHDSRIGRAPRPGADVARCTSSGGCVPIVAVPTVGVDHSRMGETREREDHRARASRCPLCMSLAAGGRVGRSSTGCRPRAPRRTGPPTTSTARSRLLGHRAGHHRRRRTARSPRPCRGVRAGDTVYIGGGHATPRPSSPLVSGTAKNAVTVTRLAGPLPVIGTGAGRTAPTWWAALRGGLRADVLRDPIGRHLRSAAATTSPSAATPSPWPGSRGRGAPPRGSACARAARRRCRGNTSDHNSSHGIYLGPAPAGNTIEGNEASFNAEGWQRNANGIDVVSPGNTVLRQHRARQRGLRDAVLLRRQQQPGDPQRHLQQRRPRHRRLQRHRRPADRQHRLPQLHQRHQRRGHLRQLHGEEQHRRRQRRLPGVQRDLLLAASRQHRHLGLRTRRPRPSTTTSSG